MWLAFQKAIDDWCDIPELDDENRGPALRNRVEGDAAIYKGILDRDLLKAKRMVLRISVDLETFLCEESVNFVLCRFQHFVNLRRASSDLMKWMSRFQIHLMQTLEEKHGETRATPSQIKQIMKRECVQKESLLQKGVSNPKSYCCQ